MKSFTSNAGISHSPSTVMVFQSDDYNKFNMIQGNRQLDMVKIKKILADIDRGTNLLKYVPILVVEREKKFDIVDGQHRFMVSKKIKSPVYYIIGESLSLYDIARMNSNTEKWKAKDFINCYSELGNDNYKKLDAFIKKYPGLPVTSCVNLMSKGKIGAGGANLVVFQRGEFIALKEMEAEKICSTASKFDHESKFSRTFITAICKILDSGIYPIDDLIKRVNGDPDQLQLQDHYKKYLTNLEEIASKGKHKRVAIY
jgi:hypothetical protein